jgi:uncharacterized protein YdcH (DUF465 family)
VVWHTADVRWARLFEDLDGQIEAAEQADRAAAAAELQRLEVSRVSLADRLGGAVGSPVTVAIEGLGPLPCVPTQVGGDWALVQSAGAETLVALSAVTAVTDLPVATGPPHDDIDRALGLGFVLRRLARDRAPVAVVARTGEVFTGTIDRVGADFLDVAEHAADLARRADAVQRVRTVPFVAVAVVRPA